MVQRHMATYQQIQLTNKTATELPRGPGGRSRLAGRGPHPSAAARSCRDELQDDPNAAVRAFIDRLANGTEHSGEVTVAVNLGRGRPECTDQPIHNALATV
jgi:hypothetical protein